MQSWLHVLEDAAARNPSRDALRDDQGTSVTYAELLSQVERVAGGWATLPVGPGDPVALIMRNSVGFAKQILGLHRAGAIPVLINWRLAAAEVDKLMELFEPVAVAAEAEFMHLIDSSSTSYRVVAPEEWSTLDDEPPPRPVERLLSSSEFVVTHTSGTTGTPKGVPLTNGPMILGAMTTFSRTAGRQPGQVHLRVMPMFHLSGLAGVLQGVLGGDTVIIQNRFDPADFLDTVERERVAFSNAGPSLLRRICDEQERQPRDLSSLIELWYGTESMPPDVLSRALRLIGCSFRQNYGMTEAQRPVSQLDPEDHSVDNPHLGSAGRPMPGVEIRIVDTAGQDVLPGAPGEIWIRTDSLFPGYWRSPEATALAFDGPADPPGMGWYRTGDIGSMSDGYLTIRDRLKDMIITGGENVYAAEVEAVIREHPDVTDVAVVGLECERWGETVHAAVVAAGPDPDADAIINFCRDRLAHFKCPTGMTFIAELPRNATGKAMRREVRNLLRNSSSEA